MLKQSVEECLSMNDVHFSAVSENEIDKIEFENQNETFTARMQLNFKNGKCFKIYIEECSYFVSNFIPTYILKYLIKENNFSLIVDSNNRFIYFSSATISKNMIDPALILDYFISVFQHFYEYAEIVKRNYEDYCQSPSIWIEEHLPKKAKSLRAKWNVSQDSTFMHIDAAKFQKYTKIMDSSLKPFTLIIKDLPIDEIEVKVLAQQNEDLFNIHQFQCSKFVRFRELLKKCYKDCFGYQIVVQNDEESLTSASELNRSHALEQNMSFTQYRSIEQRSMH
jgi:hypothetical protein